LNKKDVPPSTIKESTESSQTIDDSDGLGTSSTADKGDWLLKEVVYI